VSLSQRFARLILTLSGWTLIEGAPVPARAVLLGYPHTSNWDLIATLIGLMALGIKPRWAGKDTMFRGWRGTIIRALGGIPVNRRTSTGFVGRMAEEIAAHETFLLAVAPEGTRAKAAGWKSGFYRIALAAQVPVVAGVADYRRKELGILAVLAMTGDEEADMARIAALYEGREGLRPGNRSPVRLLK
jgi:1-acyl-sn-glycerol-3-phosphate acyltransferase